MMTPALKAFEELQRQHSALLRKTTTHGLPACSEEMLAFSQLCGYQYGAFLDAALYDEADDVRTWAFFWAITYKEATGKICFPRLRRTAGPRRDSAVLDAAARTSCIREAIRSRTPPEHLDAATMILDSRGFDPAILADDSLMNEGLWKSVIRFCEREAELGTPAMTRLLKRPAQRRHFGYTDINSGFSELESAVKKLVRPEELLGGVNWSMEKGQGNEENLRDSFTQATLSSERILFSFTNFVYGEPRETNLGYISLGSQGLLCIVVHRKARVFLPVNRVKNIQSIIELNELLEQCRQGSKESETPGLNVNVVTRRPSEVLAAKMEGAVAASSDLLHAMCDEAMDKASRLRGHSGFIFDQVALAAAGHYRLKPGTEKELPEQTGILPSDADGLITEIQENKFGEDTIWALDPWFYYCLDRTKLGDEYEVHMLAHNLKIPVGLAFTDLFLPVMMRSKDQMLTIRNRAFTALKSYAGGLQAIGVAVNGIPLEKNGSSKTTPEVATQPQNTSEPRQAKQ